MKNSTLLTPFIAKHFHDFWRPFEKQLSKPDHKKTFSLVKGIIQSGTIQLCSIGREMEKDILPKTFCEKTSKTLKGVWSLMNMVLLKAWGMKFKYFILDESEIQRSYAKKIKGIQKVRDGSTGNLYGQGYPLITVVGVTEWGQYVPLILARYTYLEKARRACVKRIIEAFGPHHGGIWIVDRGCDDEKFFDFLLHEEQDFLIRLDRKGGQRCLRISEKEQYLVSDLTAHMKDVGYRRVYLRNHDAPLTLVHYAHGKDEPLALLTTLSPRTEKQAKRIGKMYLKRWQIENYLRFVKQRFGLEEIMLQGVKQVDGILALVLIASAFVMEQSYKMRTSIFKQFFRVWRKKERCTFSWSSVGRFLRTLFREWELRFRTEKAPPDSLQLALFPS